MPAQSISLTIYGQGANGQGMTLVYGNNAILASDMAGVLSGICEEATKAGYTSLRYVMRQAGSKFSGILPSVWGAR